MNNNIITFPGKNLSPDLEQARRFLTLLDEQAQRFTFQTFDDGKSGKDRALTRVFHGTLEQHAAELARLQRRGAGVFVTVNRTDLQGRRLANITGARVAFMEDDGAGVLPLPLLPHITVETSPGHFHRYWSVEGLSLEDARDCQDAMVAQYGSDPGAKDLSRVLRLPGFFHQKDPEHPHMVRIIEESAWLPYNRDEFYEGMRIQAVERKPSAPAHSLEGEPLPDSEYERIKAALSHIPADERPLWLDIGMALHSTGAAQAFSLWDEWSQKSDKYNYADAVRVWDSFGERTGTTIATLYYHAVKHGWKPPRNQTLAGVEPKFTNRAIPAEQASAELDRLAGQPLEGVRAIEGAAGLGKSTRIQQAVEAAIKAEELNSGLLFTPSHRLGKEVVDRSEVDAKAQKGRLQEGARGPLCKRDALVKSLNDRGIYNVMGLLCSAKDPETKKHIHCPHFHQCEYILQHESRALKALPHNYLTLPETILDVDSDPGVLVIDEDFHNQVECFGKWHIGDLIGAGIDILKDLVNILNAGDPILPTLRQRDDPIAEVNAALDQFQARELPINPSMPDKAIAKAILNLTHEDIKTFPYRLLVVLKDALESDAPETTAIWYDKKHHLVRAAWLNPIAKRYQDIPTIILDATMNVDLLRHSFPDIEHHKIEVERNAHVTQVMSATMSNRRLEPLDSDPEDRKRYAAQTKANLERKAAELAAKHGPGLVVAKKSYMESFTVPDECMKAHFGDLRGRNQWESAQWVMVIGRNEPPITAMENRARCYYGNDPEPLKITGTVESKPAGYRMRNGEKIGVMGRYHADERVQDIMQLAREDESIQAIDRIRLIHGNLKHVYIVCNLPLDITVDKLTTMQEFMEGGSRLEQVLTDSQVIVMNHAWLMEKFPTLFETLESAKHFVKRQLKLGPTCKKNYYLQHGPKTFALVKVRLQGQRGRQLTPVLTTLDDAETKAWLAHELGKPLVAYERLTPIEETKPAPQPTVETQPLLASAWRVFVLCGPTMVITGKPMTQAQAMHRIERQLGIEGQRKTFATPTRDMDLTRFAAGVHHYYSLPEDQRPAPCLTVNG